MTFRQDYKVEAHFNEASGSLHSLTWTNQLGLVEAPSDLPSVVIYSAEGYPTVARWYRHGELHRDGDLPAIIQFDKEGNPYSWSWYQHGNQHRDGGRPAHISFFDAALTMPGAIEFYEKGEPYREGGKPPQFYFDMQGNAADPDETMELQFEGFEEGWLPKPLPTITAFPQPLLRSPESKP